MPDLKDTNVCGEPRIDGQFCPTSPHRGEVHTLADGTVFRTVPLIGDEALIGERLRLALLDVEALNAELEPARYVLGPSGCADSEDHNYDEYDGSDSEWCSHVEHRIATFADVRARERLEETLLDIRRTAANASLPETAADLAEHIDNELEQLREELKDIGGLEALSVSDLRAVLAQIEDTHRRWREDPVQEQITAALDRMFAAEEKAKLLRVEVRDLKADKEWLLAQGGDRLRTALINAKRAKAAPGGTERSAVEPSDTHEGPDIAAQVPEGGDRG